MSQGTSAVEELARLSVEQAAEVARLVDAAYAADGVRPLSDAAVLALRYDDAGSPVRHLLLREPDGALAGYASLDPTDAAPGWSAELVVDPARRGRGHGRALLHEALGVAAGEPLRTWAHGRHPAAVALARSTGFTPVRELWQMRRPLDGDLPEVPLPAGVVMRAFVPGRDDDAWLAANARAFATHPEQGTWTAEDLHQRMREPWFDPEGFFLAERGDQLLGFHWTKVHERGPVGEIPLGEIYVLGVDPAGQGLGLGRALAVVGLRHLQDRGLPEAMLYTDADNAPAVRLYRNLGFTHQGTDVMFAHR